MLLHCALMKNIKINILTIIVFYLIGNIGYTAQNDDEKLITQTTIKSLDEKQNVNYITEESLRNQTSKNLFTGDPTRIQTEYFTGEKNKLMVEPNFTFNIGDRLLLLQEGVDFWVYDLKPKTLTYGIGLGFIQSFYVKETKTKNGNKETDDTDHFLLNHYFTTMIKFGYLITWENGDKPVAAIRPSFGVGYFWSLNHKLQHAEEGREYVKPLHTLAAELGFSFMLFNCFDFTIKYLYLNKVELLDKKQTGVSLFSMSFGIVFDI